jgi:uncharacterized membrane protein YfcA
VPDYVRYALVALVVFLTHFQNSITGFGSAALALPFLVLLIGLEVAVPALIVLGWLIAVLIVVQSWRQIVWREYATIVVLTLIGMPIGVWISGVLPEFALKMVLAVFMMAVGAHGLIVHLAQSKPEAKSGARTKWLLSGFLPLGGIVQGAFGTGGPLIIIYATKALRDKGVFRVTLCLLWATINPIVIAMRWAAGHRLDADAFKVVGICLIPMLLGLALGSRAHHRVNEVTFRRIVYTVLILSGIMLAYPLMPKLIQVLGSKG